MRTLVLNTEHSLADRNYIMAVDSEGNLVGVFDLGNITKKLGDSYAELMPNSVDCSDGMMFVGYTCEYKIEMGFPFIIIFNEKDIVCMIYQNSANDPEPHTFEKIRKIRINEPMIDVAGEISFVANKKNVIMTLIDSVYDAHLFCCNIDMGTINSIGLQLAFIYYPFICEDYNELYILAQDYVCRRLVIVFDLNYDFNSKPPSPIRIIRIENDNEDEIPFFADIVSSYGLNINGNINGNIHLKTSKGKTILMKQFFDA